MKRLLLLSTILVTSLSIYAEGYDILIDGIYYKINAKEKTAEVTNIYGGYDYDIEEKKSDYSYTCYRGDIIIPEAIPFKGTMLKVTSIGDWAFANCFNLISVVLPDNLLSIGEYAFYECSSLSSFELPNNLSSIGVRAFYGCWKFTSVRIPQSVTSIGDDAFYNSSLESMYIEDGDSLLKIGMYGGGSRAFLRDLPIKNLYIGRSIECKVDYFGYNLRELTDISFSPKLSYINGYFKNCLALNAVHISDIVAWCQITFGHEYSNPLSLAKHLYLNGEEVVDLIIPDEVTNIGSFVFEGCISLNSVKIGKGVQTIGSKAFQMCRGLNSVEIPNDGSLTEINSEAFTLCNNLKTLEIPNSVTSIGHGAFGDCSSLSSIEIPNTITRIEKAVFGGCSNLISIVIPNSVTSIGDGAFSGCTGLSSVIIPNNVTSLGSRAFSNCSGLISVTIGNGIIGIPEQAFGNCSGLQILNLGNNIKSIEQTAFDGCTELTDVYCYAKKAPSAGDALFKDSWIEFLTLHVPYGTSEQYKAHSLWSKFGTIVEMEKTAHVITYMVDGEVYQTEEYESGDAIIPLEVPTKEGYTFSGWSEIPETMPAHDVTVTGSFTINKYKVTYMVDGIEYASTNVEYGAAIMPNEIPIKEGYSFSGWTDLPETMPAHDVTVSGTFTINKYKVTYMVDGVEYKTVEVEYGSTITPEASLSKEGYTFSGWTDLPETMPAHDVTVTGTFTINKYKVTYIVDGEEYGTSEVVYGAEVNPIEEPSKEGYTFSGWLDLPEEMPANDVTVSGTFTVNKYKVTFMYGDNVLTTIEVNYGEAIELPESLNSERYTLIEWKDVPESMPAYDVIIYADYVDGINTITADSKNEQYIRINGMYTNELKQGVNIIRTQDGKTRKVWVK